jgi:hypothetical protein
MWKYQLLVAVGFVLIVLLMIFVINPPEAWIKRLFSIKAKPKPEEKPQNNRPV